MPRSFCCICGSRSSRRFSSSLSYQQKFAAVFSLAAADRSGLICDSCRRACAWLRDVDQREEAESVVDKHTSAVGRRNKSEAGAKEIQRVSLSIRGVRASYFKTSLLAKHARDPSKFLYSFSISLPFEQLQERQLTLLPSNTLVKVIEYVMPKDLLSLAASCRYYCLHDTCNTTNISIF